MVHFVEVFLTFSLSPFAMARESSRLETLFDKHPPVEDMSPKHIKSKKSCENGSYKRKKRPKKTEKTFILCRGLHLYMYNSRKQ